MVFLFLKHRPELSRNQLRPMHDSMGRSAARSCVIWRTPAPHLKKSRWWRSQAPSRQRDGGGRHSASASVVVQLIDDNHHQRHERQVHVGLDRDDVLVVVGHHRAPLMRDRRHPCAPDDQLHVLRAAAQLPRAIGADPDVGAGPDLRAADGRRGAMREGGGGLRGNGSGRERGREGEGEGQGEGQGQRGNAGVGEWPLSRLRAHRRRGLCPGFKGPSRVASEGKQPQGRSRKRLDRRLEEVAEAVGGGYCRLRMPLQLALGVRETVARRRLGALEGGGGGGF